MAESRPILAEPPAESPSTMKISVRLGSFFAAVGQLAGHPAGLQRALAAHQLAGLFGGGAGAGGLCGFFKMAFATPGFSSKNSISLE